MRVKGLRGLPLGGALEIDRAAATELGARWAADNLRPVLQAQPQPVQGDRSDYGAAYNSTAQVPAGQLLGVALPVGRCWAEARGITHSGGSGSVGVVLVGTQKGVRCTVIAPEGQTITGGSVRFWAFDPVTQLWALGAVDEALSVGARAVSTSDQFVTVGA